MLIEEDSNKINTKILLYPTNSIKIIIFGKNPVSGGIPPIENKFNLIESFKYHGIIATCVLSQILFKDITNIIKPSE